MNYDDVKILEEAVEMSDGISEFALKSKDLLCNKTKIGKQVSAVLDKISERCDELRSNLQYLNDTIDYHKNEKVEKYSKVIHYYDEVLDILPNGENLSVKDIMELKDLITEWKRDNYLK